MKLWNFTLALCAYARQGCIRAHVNSRRMMAVISMGCAFAAHAKDTALTAVVLYDGPQGAAYVQVTELTLNGKTEVRVCDGVAKIEKSTYDALPRVSLAGATSLQRGTNGVITLTVNAKPVCIIPSHLKFDKKSELTPADAAEQAVLLGNPVSSSTLNSGIPALKPGVQLVFITAPDAEMADFLRTQRANSLKDWQEFLVKYPSSAHQTAARQAIAGLHEQVAETAFRQYEQSSSGGTPDLALLRQASQETQAANQAAAGYGAAAKLMDAIDRELDRLLDPDRAHLQAFQKALQDHTPGYSQLAEARLHAWQLSEIRPDYTPLLNLRREIAAEERKIEITLANANELTASGRYDDAVNSLGAYMCFASEMPRVDAVLRAAYRYHLDSAQRMSDQQNWEQAVTEFRKALALRPESKEAAAGLSNATVQVNARHDQVQANLALLQSNDYASKGEVVEAYNVLADLPDKPRALVAAQLAALSHDYVASATRRAQKLQEVHVPIKDRADENAVREAYVMLDRAAALSGDPAVTLKRDFLSAKISTYYVDQASRYLDRPSGAGAGVGWLYLNEAQRYGVTNLDNLKDQMARYASLYQRRAGLSVGIVLRDQTSRRDSPGFADQLAEAIASGLESSGVPIEVVRKPSDMADSLQPNFTVNGEVIEHRVTRNTNLETPQSKYRAGTHEIKNPAWLQVKSDYESAEQQLVVAQQALAAAQSHKKKEAIAAADSAVQEAQKHADELRNKMDATDQNQVEAVVESYHYTKKTIDLSASVDLSVRVTSKSGNVVGQAIGVQKNNRQTTVVLQDVKPEDTEGMTNQGVEPDGTQFLTDIETEARNTLVKAIREAAAGLPTAILQEARTRAQRGDPDGAAEEYVIYLNSTAEASSPERDEAAKFLHDQFNLAVPVAARS